MPEIRAFRGLRYDQKKIDLPAVVAPPYDVISVTYQDELYTRSPYNVVRLILGRTADRYQEAAMCLSEWREQGILRMESDPCLYVLSQGFRGSNGKEYLRTGFIAECRLEDFSSGVILPHERTHSKPKEDRLRLLQATKTNLSQIFALYADGKGEIDDLLQDAMHADPVLNIEFEGVGNRLWSIDDREIIERIRAEMSGKVALIADGHHRYETALAYRDLRRFTVSEPVMHQSWNHTMIFFTNMESEGLVIFPTHRLVHHLSGFTSSDFFFRIAAEFESFESSSQANLLKLLSRESQYAFGVVTRDRSSVIRLRHKSHLAQLVGESLPAEIRELDVTLLHNYIIERVIGISAEAQAGQSNINYVKDPEEAIQAVHQGSAQIAFLMNPTRMDQVRRVSHAGLTMPQKSTYFYPKLVSGLVINPLQ